MSCEFCSGTFYLLDQPGLGPCACCTPEAMARLVAARQVTADRIRTYRARAERRVQSEIDDYNSLWDDAAAACDALQAYFVRWGFPADPVTLPDPHLWAVWRALEDFKP